MLKWFRSTLTSVTRVRIPLGPPFIELEIDIKGLLSMERSRDWMEQAEGDLTHSQSDIERGFYEWSCFSSQQAAEKAVKAVFQKMGAEAWGHSVSDLLQELSKRYEVPKELVDGALELDKAYIPTRYPNAHPSGSPRARYIEEEARRLFRYADKIIKFCADLLSKI